MKTSIRLRIAGIIISVMLMSCLNAIAKESRPAQWAAPKIVAGAYNLHKVTDSLYRSAQPTAAGMKNLEKLGIKTVINLRAHHSDAKLIKGTSLRNEEIEINTWKITDDEIAAVLKILAHPENGPFLIHCQHGADRTGVSCAMYRIIFQGWTKDAAIDEMVNGGYGFHSIWTNIIAYVKKVDVEKVKKEVEK
jgi:protein tyrosine/serine phosphatase